MDELDDLTPRLRALGQRPVDPAVASRHLTAMAAAGRRPASRFARAKVVAAFAAGLVLGGTGLASAGVMGDTARDTVADAAAKVNVNLPGGTARSTEGCGGATYKNHGDFVRHGGDPKSACGKPSPSVATTSSTEDDHEGAGCKPPWAGHGKATKDLKKANADWVPAAGCREDESSTSVAPTSSTPPATRPVTPPSGGKDANAGVPGGGSVPGAGEKGSDHRTDVTGPPPTLPAQADTGRGADDATTGTPQQP